MDVVIRSCARRQPYLCATRYGIRHQPMGRRRYLSDRMMGYSPMAPTSPVVEWEAKMPSAQDVTTSGGVWAPTSAKRDKLTELNLALEKGHLTLDDAATPEQKLDLHLADGLHAIAKAAEQKTGNVRILHDLEAWMDQEAKDLPQNLQNSHWESYLKAVSRKAAAMSLRDSSAQSLKYVRDFFEYTPAPDETELLGHMTAIEEAFDQCVTIHRLGLLKAAADHLLESWHVLTKVSDADIDRAAVQGVGLDPQASTLPLSKLNDVLRAFVGGTCEDRVSTMWALMDRDGDGLLDHSEMDALPYLIVTPVENSLQALFEGAVQEYPVRWPLYKLDSNVAPPFNMGWRERGRENRIGKRLRRIFGNTLKTHWVNEVEMPHRLRCIYAWADKAHQDNKIDSVHVESAEWGGRRRYVELEPKISLSEFRHVQKEHFAHLDRVGQETLYSFRENLLVDQGKGRQRRELQRDCLLFLTVVSIVDLIITSL